MNAILEAYARHWLKDHLMACSDNERHVFNLMYSHTDTSRPTAVVVDTMPVEKLDWAMVQVKRTVDKRRLTA